MYSVRLGERSDWRVILVRLLHMDPRCHAAAMAFFRHCSQGPRRLFVLGSCSLVVRLLFTAFDWFDLLRSGLTTRETNFAPCVYISMARCIQTTSSSPSFQHQQFIPIHQGINIFLILTSNISTSLDLLRLQLARNITAISIPACPTRTTSTLKLQPIRRSCRITGIPSKHPHHGPYNPPTHHHHHSSDTHRP